MRVVVEQGVDGTVAHEFLDRARVRSATKKLAGERVTQLVVAYLVTLNPCGADRYLEPYDSLVAP